MLKKTTVLLEAVLRFVITILTAALTIMIFTQVVLRHMFGAGLVWSEELSLIFFAWLGFLGVSLGVRRKSHISVEFIFHLFPKFGKYINAFQLLLTMVFFGVLTVYGFNFTLEGMEAVTAVLFIPKGYLYGVIPVASALSLIFTLERLLDLRNPDQLLDLRKEDAQ